MKSNIDTEKAILKDEKAFKILTKSLEIHEVEVRVQKKFGNQAVMLLYKTAKIDQDRLDKAYGMKWKTIYQDKGDGVIECTLSVWSYEIQDWISRVDIGKAPNIEKEKGKYSDSLKRAGTNFGIGRVLKTQPKIILPCSSNDNLDDVKIASLNYSEDGNIIEKVVLIHKGKEFVFKNKYATEIGKCQELTQSNEKKQPNFLNKREELRKTLNEFITTCDNSYTLEKFEKQGKIETFSDDKCQDYITRLKSKIQCKNNN